MVGPANRRQLIASFAAGMVLVLGGTAVQAQQFSFSISSGYPRYCGHHHGCGPYWGPWYGPGFGFVYAPPPVIAAPPVIQERIVYVEPPRATSWSSAANAPISTPPTNTAASRAANTDSRITIHNASGAKLPVAFLLDGQDIELADGAAQSFTGQTKHVVEYDRGGRYGSTRQEIAPGDYDFRITASGWDLVRRPIGDLTSHTAVRSNSLPQKTSPVR
jgi:hypothetical protein